MIVVSDTSPITSLLAIGRVAILQTLFDVVVVPRAVAAELEAYRDAIPPFITVEPVTDTRAVEELSTILDGGEAEAIILAEELRADYLLVDEKLGRKVASERGLQVVGLLGVLARAKGLHAIDSIRDVIEALERDAGFYLSDTLKDLILKETGED